MAPRKGSGDYPVQFSVRVTRANYSDLEMEARLRGIAVSGIGREVVRLGLAAVRKQRETAWAAVDRQAKRGDRAVGVPHFLKQLGAKPHDGHGKCVVCRDDNPFCSR
jgi:hypothetical protein